jgi:L-amino acid N-acyltransferase YncA
MDCIEGNSLRTISITADPAGDIAVRRRPVSGSSHMACPPARAIRDCPASARASRAESVIPNAPDKCPSRAAVGLVSPRSILLIIAFETPDRSANSASDQERALRSSRMRLASRASISLTIVATGLVYETDSAKEMAMELRDIRDSDLPGILEIYNEVIANSTAIYAETPTSMAELVVRMKARQQQNYPVLVAASGEEVLGFTSFGDFRAWPCYRHTVEHTLHVRSDQRGRGLGRHLLEALIRRAVDLGKHVLIAGIDADNHVSIKLHQRMGFEQVAHFREVGRKFDRWLDLVFMQRFLDAPGRSPK